MPKISHEILRKNFSSTPADLSPTILSLCHQISPQYAPLYLSVEPDARAAPSECFNNVAAKVEMEGGSLLYGWLIWEWPRVFIEAEHHAVWKNDDSLVDITPLLNGERRILFLPDPNASYDFAFMKRKNNIRRSHGIFQSVDEWISANDELHEIREKNSIGNRISIGENDFMRMNERILNGLGSIFLDLAKTTRRNDPCFCRSGKKFKKCCAPLIEL